MNKLCIYCRLLCKKYRLNNPIFLYYQYLIFQQKEELYKRIEIIKEIKALSSIKDLNADKFDPTETMNIGLLSEMSLAEVRIQKNINNEQIVV